MRELRVVAVIVGTAIGVAGCGGRGGPPAPVTQHGESRPALSRAEAASGAVVVQPGETLYAISRRTGVALRALIDTNGLQAPYRLREGQRLALPGRSTAPAAAGNERASRVGQPGPSGAAVVESSPLPSQGPARPSPAPPPAAPSEGGAVPSAAAPVSPPLPAPLPSSAPAAAPDQGSQGVTKPAAAAPAPVDTPAPARAARVFLWPVRGTIVSGFGAKTGGLQNDGINIAGPHGAPVRAAENGVVVYAGNELKGFGNLLLLRHADGWMSAYAHLDEIQVERGQTVQRGQTIARLGQTGSVTTPQLHFELRRAGKAVDPRGHLPPTQTARAE